MHFNGHSEIPPGSHAFLSPSSYHWINYDEDKLIMRYRTAMAAAHGTRLHEFAEMAIRLGARLQASKKTLNQFVNDCIGFDMVPEQILYYSPNAFGTVDAIRYYEPTKKKRALLRISDLKTGKSPTSMKQLEAYVALFCLEYGYKPFEMDIELRIYQNDEVVLHTPELEDIVHIMDRFVTFDKLIDEIKRKEIQ